jgi:undecaprenyl-diphosphatase
MHSSTITPLPLELIGPEQTGPLDSEVRGLAARFFARLEGPESRIVERCVDHARRHRLIGVARGITRAGDGWLYAIASALLLLTSFHNAVRCLAAAAVSLAIAFILYPPLKRILARPRPYHLHRDFADALAPIDRHSFPSGHAMTAAAFGVPIIIAAPMVATPIVVGGCALVSWSRIALGHHYPTDIAAGMMIGALIATAVAGFLL